MIFHQDWQKDKRCRFYLPVSRILKNDGVDNAEILIGNREFQTVIHYMPAIALFTPGSSLLIDFGKAIHGGIRFNNIFCSGRIRLEFGESISECIGNSNPDCSVKDTVLDLPHCGMLEYGNTVFRFVRVTNAGQENIKCLNILGVALEHDLECRIISMMEPNVTALSGWGICTRKSKEYCVHFQTPRSSAIRLNF